MTNKRTTSSRPAAVQSRLPYEAPRLEITALRPEEQLLVCLKSNSLYGLCFKMLTTS
jgi:hypothetical protein